MAKMRMNNYLWNASKVLAAELAQRNFDNNLLRTAASYMKAYPDADLEDWLNRLLTLGEIFRSSDRTEDYRRELEDACSRLKPHPHNSREWLLVLSWAGRLEPYYRQNLSEARRISDVAGLQLPPPPAPFHRSLPPAAEDDLPEVREEVSPEAEDLFTQIQARWGQHEEDED